MHGWMVKRAVSFHSYMPMGSEIPAVAFEISMKGGHLPMEIAWTGPYADVGGLVGFLLGKGVYCW